MGCLGVHFSLSADEVERLREIPDEVDRVDYLHEVIEEEYFEHQPERYAESDKSWDAMHRALSDGKLTRDGGEYPLNQVVLGGKQLYADDDFIMVLKSPEVVRDVAQALPAVTQADFRRRYFAIHKSYEGLLDEEDFEYTWNSFVEVREFWLRAASEGRFVLFTADQ